MARKFQIGDVAEIVKKNDDTFDNRFKIGECVKIISYRGGVHCPYQAQRLKGRIHSWFMLCELKFVRRAKKK